MSNTKKIRDLAYNSAKIYFAGKQRTPEQFQAYQIGFMNAYTTAYIKASRKNNRV